ncbi:MULTISPECIES: hypothetical protein [unclassified Mycobacterium]|uniref:hypothetical protein n=1 Tax=unclassified Mycobacterium TaxID=2642494 RepID=UPI0029C685CF|nr:MULTISPECIES: hypothetical protein [unclassified Mycobacterium]
MTTRIGITGHQALPASAVPTIESVFRSILDAEATGTVISCLAAGADQLLATLAVAHGFGLEAVVPCRDYESSFAPEQLPSYRTLLDTAESVLTLGFPEPSEDAYLAAGQEIVERCDVLAAVWDGLPAKGKGGTGDVVEFARACGRPVRVIWPAGVSRD